MENKKLIKIVNICTSLAAVLLLLMVGFCNRNYLLPTFLSGDYREYNDLEQEYKGEFAYRENWLNAYGITQKLLNRHIVNDFTYVQDENGMMHYIYNINLNMVQGVFEPDVVHLAGIVESKGGHFLYIQGLNREALGQNKYLDDFSNIDEISDEIVAYLDEQGVDVLDLRESALNEPTGLKLEDAFFNTDLHMETDAEFWAAREIVSYLEEEYKMEFPRQEWLYDMELYDKKTFPFVGDFCRDVGEVYEEIDFFDEYIPKGESRLSIYDYLSDMITEGRFENVLMNDFEGKGADKYTYWVCDYLRFPNPYYKITNYDCDGPDILILCDSIGYRTISYMALTSGSITILDPRYYNGIDYTTLALDTNYDIVIVYQQIYLSESPLFPNNDK